ncbi:DUF3667 domain-containing protein [Joostella sp.]|uniref:DUF3667 domain-containing protein n=1 Tax=Joostella sp. TaxID=2231138 RepID=UPI003A927C28
MTEGICKNCKTEITQNYCPNCGIPKSLKRIDGKYIANEIGGVLNFDKGILCTIKELIIRPGNTVKEFILNDRSKIVRPIIFIIICSLIYSVLEQFLNFEKGYIYYDESIKSTSMSIFGWVKENYGYGNLMMGVFIAFWTKVLFKKYSYNYYEILILLCFVMGIGMLILAIFGTIEWITKLKILQFGGMLFVVYSTWATGQFFDKKKFSSYLKAFVSYFLGMITFIIGVFVVGKIIDLII